MGLLQDYLTKVEAVDARVAETQKNRGDSSFTSYVSMFAEAKKGEMRAAALDAIGIRVSMVAAKNLGPGFTFEDFLAEVDRLLG